MKTELRFQLNLIVNNSVNILVILDQCDILKLAVQDKMKKFKCNQCEYAANRIGDLKKHVMAVHDRVKNFKCGQCEHSTSAAENLKQHILDVHDKVRKFK